MKPLKIVAFSLLLFCFYAQPAQAGVPVTCANCSNFIQQILDSITMANELTTAIEQYSQLVTQTQQQLYMVQSEMRRLMTLPGSVTGKYVDQFTELGQLLGTINMYRGDLSAMTDIYRAAYPDFSKMYGLALDNPNAVQDEWVRRSQHSDKVAEQAFKLSGTQLAKLSQDQDALRSHVQTLLGQENETQILQSGNVLTSMMLSDVQDLKSLSAMSLQHIADQNLAKQKEAQANKGLWDAATKTEKLDFKYDWNPPF